MAKKVLVTGGAGFIGSHVADALLAQGYTVHILDDLSSGRRDFLPQAAIFHEMDIRDAAVHDLFAAEQFPYMVHLAAQMDVRKSVADPSFDADINVRGFLNLMEAGRRYGLQKVVFSSTGGAIYGEPVSVPQDEAHPVQPISPYGITKLVTEKYLHYYQHLYAIDYVALRYGNVYGPRQNPHGDAGVVAIFSERLLQGQAPFIFGDGTQTRDYVYVGDVVAANCAALDQPISGIFNIGTGQETTVNTLFAILREASGQSVEAIYQPARPGEQLRSVISYQQAHEAFGFTPSRAVEDGLAETFAWFARQSDS